MNRTESKDAGETGDSPDCTLHLNVILLHCILQAFSLLGKNQTFTSTQLSEAQIDSLSDMKIRIIPNESKVILRVLVE